MHLPVKNDGRPKHKYTCIGIRGMGMREGNAHAVGVTISFWDVCQAHMSQLFVRGRCLFQRMRTVNSNAEYTAYLLWTPPSSLLHCPSDDPMHRAFAEPARDWGLLEFQPRQSPGYSQTRRWKCLKTPDERGRGPWQDRPFPRQISRFSE